MGSAAENGFPGPAPAYGVDGCPAGWFYVGLEGSAFQFGIVGALFDLPREGRNCAPILVDIPIGLPSARTPVRDCDRLCRRLIGPRSSSVFGPPARASLSAGDYRQAVVMNEEVTGKRISRQAWNLAPRLREADAVARAGHGDEAPIREAHPELCFTVLAGGRPMGHYKKTEQGHEERLAVLARHYPPARELVRRALESFPRSQVGRDDIVDALVLAVSAGLCRSDLRTLPPLPQKDEAGLPMEIVYPGVEGVDISLEGIAATPVVS